MRPGNPEALSAPYDPTRIEPARYPFWEQLGVFRPREGDGKDPFVIAIPPPNVTGSLTMGHLLGESIRDCIIRWQRMEGRETLYVPGMDHAGIATQNVVEKKLKSEGRSRHQLGREGFLAEVWKWKEEYGGLIFQQERRLGTSPDWSRERFTLDEGYSHAVLHVFKKLYDEGLVYRGRYIVNWCPRCQTALSDEEVEHRETQGSLWYIRYPIAGSEKQAVVVATTRPETMLGDTGVAVSPKDQRYKKLVGKNAVLPLMRREIPIVADPT
ncbi:MAG TPA: class I tRNA ligase family protein, partial [Dongiaceae bacterium]|nr:class I tRNA ligase family protein [Dongiaceae bacterium]